MERWNELTLLEICSTGIVGRIRLLVERRPSAEDPSEPKISSWKHSAGGKDPAVGNTFPAVGPNVQ